MRLVVYFLVIVFTTTSFYALSQNLDTTSAINNLKFQIIDYTNIRNQEFYNQLRYKKLEIKTLRSKGFEGFAFFSVDINPFRDTIQGEVVFKYCGQLVFGISLKSNKFYRIKGFDENDFLYLMNNNFNCDDYVDDISNEMFFIESIDIKCLCKSLTKRKKKKASSPCLQPLPSPEMVSGLKF